MKLSGQNCIEVQDLRKDYRQWHRRESVPALKSINLSVRQGEVFGFLGPNGAGKTTTVKLILGLLKPDAGTIFVMGKPPGDLSVKNKIGYMPERTLLPDYLRLEEMLRIFGSLSGLSGHDLRQAIERTLAAVQLSDVRHRRMDTFSKGMLQRASLAQALLSEPDLLILDEPTNGLDPMTRRDLKLLIQSLRQKGVTVFLNSHELEVVEQVCDRFAILNKGQILTEQPISALKDTRSYLVELDESSLDKESLCSSLSCQAVWQAAPGALLAVECGDAQGLNRTIDELRARNCVILSVNARTLSLEELFLSHLEPASTA